MFSPKAALPPNSGAFGTGTLRTVRTTDIPGIQKKGHFSPTAGVYLPDPDQPTQVGIQCPPLPGGSPEPPASRSHLFPRPPRLGSSQLRCCPSSPAPSCPHRRSSTTVHESFLPPRLVATEVPNPWGLHCFCPCQAESIFQENKTKLCKGLRKLCGRERSSASGCEHTPARTRAQVHLSGRTHGQGASPRKPLRMHSSRRAAGTRGAAWASREFRNGLGKREPENGDPKHTHRRVGLPPAHF